MNLPLKIALYFIYFEGLAIPLYLVMAIYPVNRDAGVFLKFLPFPLLAIAAMIFIVRASGGSRRRKLFLSLAAVASIPLAAMITLAEGRCFVPGTSVIGLFPAVMLLEEAHCAERRRRRALVARRAFNEDGGDE